MSSVVWTAEQEQAIREVDRDVLLTAAAGSGKTAVLAQRCIYLLTDAPDPCEIDELLVLTFTEAAAAEMRRRICDALHERVQAEPNDRRLQRQLLLIDKAHISTIHAFGRSLVQEFFYLLSIDPAFDVLDAAEANLLKAQIARDVFEEVYEKLESSEGTDDLRRLVDSYGSDSGDKALTDLMIELHDFLNSLSDRSAWLERWQEQQAMIAQGQVGRLEMVQRQSLVVGRELNRVISTLAYAQNSIERFPQAQFYNNHLEEKLLGPLKGIQAALQTGNLEASLVDLKDFSFPNLPRRSKDVLAEEVEPVKNLIGQAKENYKMFTEKYGLGENEILQQLRFTSPFVNQLLKLNEEFTSRYGEKKRQQNVLDFDDLEVLSLELLRGAQPGEVTEVARLLNKRYRYVLVDEYQDVSPVQDALIKRIIQAGTEEKTPHGAHLFMVGDVKQSIYGFRQADPDIFLEKSKDIRAGGQAVQIELNKNFRSRQKVLEGINRLFNRCMSPNLSGVDYSQDAQLNYGADYYDGFDGLAGEPAAIELHLLEKKSANRIENSDDVGEPFVPTRVIEREALVVGQRITELMGQGANGEGKGFMVLDPETKEPRAIRYSDIVILLRSPKSQVDLWEHVLGQMQIPVYAELSEGFLGAAEIRDVISLLRLLDNMRQDIPLAGVLRSPFVGLTDSQLLEIHNYDTDGLFYDALQCCLKQGTDKILNKKLTDFTGQLERWRETLRFGTVSQLLWEIYQETHYLSFVRGMAQGRQRHANLLALHDLACRFEKGLRQGLPVFLRYIERMEQEDVDLSPAAVLTSADNVVRIMSIHKSKGLEFPVVIVANLDRHFNPKDRSQAVLFNRHSSGSLGLRMIDPVSKDRWASLEHHLVSDDIAHRQLAEEMRLLYVAMTRARQRLILTASVDLEKTRQEWRLWQVDENKPLPDFAIQAAKRPIDWIGTSLASHLDLQWFLDDANPEDVKVSCFMVKPIYDVGVTQSIQQDTERVMPRLLDEIFPLTIDPQVHANVDEVVERIRWNYPDELLTRLSARSSVTDLKHHAQVLDLDDGTIGASKAELGKGFLQRPKFFSDTSEKVSGADMGSWTHLFLQRIELKPKLGRVELANQLDEMVDKGILSEAQSRVIDLEKIERLFNDLVGQEILAASDGVYREWPFTLALPAQQVYSKPDLPQDETVIVRGIIDCLYETPQGMVIVDYKTDRIDPQQLDLRAESYFVPMRLYDQAVTAILNKPIAKRVLYFLHLGQSFLVP